MRGAALAAASVVGASWALLAAERADADQAPAPPERWRLLPPAWLLPRPHEPTFQQLGRAFPGFDLEEGGKQRLPVPPRGQVYVSWAPPHSSAAAAGAEAGGARLTPQQRRAVEAAALGAAQALALPGGGGLHVQVVPSARFLCCAVGSANVLLSAGAVQACWQQTAQPGEALLYLMAHEASHLALRHAEEKRLAVLAWRFASAWRTAAAELRGSWRALRQRDWAGGWGQAAEARAEAVTAVKLQLARTLQQLDWEQEFEADEGACAALAQAGVPPALWPCGLALLAGEARAPEWRLEEVQRAQRAQQASAAGAAGPAAWVVRFRAEDAHEEAFVKQAQHVLALLHRALDEQDGGGSGGGGRGGGGPVGAAELQGAASEGPAGSRALQQYRRQPPPPHQHQQKQRQQAPGRHGLITSGSSSRAAEAEFQQALGWCIPAAWFADLAPGPRAAAVLTLLNSHPPAEQRQARLERLAAAAAATAEAEAGAGAGAPGQPRGVLVRPRTGGRAQQLGEEEAAE